MANLRKLLFALTVILVATVTASAQVVPPFRCEASTAVPPLLRGESVAELVGDVILTCRDGQPTPAGVLVPRVNIQIFMNANVTSRILTGSATEALLLIDDPPPAAQNDARTCRVGEDCSLRGIYTLGNPATWQGLRYGEVGAVDGSSPAKPVINIYQGVLTQPNSIAWWGVPVDPPGTQGNRVLRIKNVRLHARSLWAEGSLVPVAATMTITISGEASVSLINPLQIVGYVQQGLTIAWRTAASDAGLPSAGASFLQCSSVNSDLAADPTKRFTTTAFRIRFNEGFATAFKVRNAATTPSDPTLVTDQATPDGKDPSTNLLFNTESGFVNRSLTDLFVPGAPYEVRAGLADHGTRLRVVFKNIPDGVRVFVGTGEIAQADDDTVLHLVTPADPVRGTGPYVRTQPTTTSAYPIAPVAISGGVGYATWEVVRTNPLVQGWVEVPVVIAYRASPPASPALGTATALATFAPIATLFTAQPWTEPLPRFTETGTDRPVFVISPCQTNLLFPYVYSDAAWDTGIAIANTSRDIFGTATQAGTCTLNFFGVGPGDGAPPSPITTPVIAPGTVWTFTLSAGGDGGVRAAGGFKGYIIAQCRFQFAHGMAFISDMGASKVAHGYLALVMDSPRGYRTGYTSEALAQ